MVELDYNMLLCAIPIKKGATVDVVSDLFSIQKRCWEIGRKFDPDKLIDAICETVGEEGTVLIRMFSWDFCHGKGYDARRTLSQVGALGNIALKRSDFRRTKHPIYSWMVWGNYQDYLCELDDTDSFGEQSVFAWEASNADVQQVVFGSPSTNGVTIFHYIEQRVGVSYRYIKDFTGKYVDEYGNESTKTYSMYVRNLNYDIVTDLDVYDEILEKKKIRINSSYEGINVVSYNMLPLCNVYEEDMRSHGISLGVKLTRI